MLREEALLSKHQHTFNWHQGSIYLELLFGGEADGWKTTFITIYTVVINHPLPLAESFFFFFLGGGGGGGELR